MYKAGLVLEGGGMKGVYTAGVLDYFLEQGVEFESCYGVSMGSCMMCSYVSKQHGRGLRTVVDNLDRKDYCGFGTLLKTGDIFNADLCYNRIPNELDLFDYETAHAYEGKAYVVITDVESGKPVYYPMKDYYKDIIAIRASSSMPLVSRMVEIDGRNYLDGGIADCIPIMRSLKDGNRKNVVIMTKEEGYRRKPFGLFGMAKIVYRKYPHLLHDLAIRHTRYNRTLDFLEKEQARGNVFVIRPKHPSEVGRIEKSREKLVALYQEGYQDAKACYEEMLLYLEK